MGRRDLTVPSRETLEQLYLTEQLSISAVANKLGTSQPTVRKWLIQYNIERRDQTTQSQMTNSDRTGTTRPNKNFSHQFLDNEERLRDLYVKQRLGKEPIAKLAKCSVTLVYKYIKKFGLEAEKAAQKQQFIQRYLDGERLREIPVPSWTLSTWLHKSGHVTRPPNDYDRPFVKISKGHQEIADYIQSLGFTVNMNDRTTVGVEIDILIPELKLGIEFNGLYYHSTQFKEQEYHLNKTRLAAEKSITLLHIYENQWLENKQLALNIIRNACQQRNVAKCIKITAISQKETNDFVVQNSFERKQFELGFAAFNSEGHPIAILAIDKKLQTARYITSINQQLTRDDFVLLWQTWCQHLPPSRPRYLESDNNLHTETEIAQYLYAGLKIIDVRPSCHLIVGNELVDLSEATIDNQPPKNVLWCAGTTLWRPK